MTSYTVDKVINNFHEFIRLSASYIYSQYDFDPTSSIIDDWLQANWELLVESVLSINKDIYLLPYGEGADCQGASSRVLFPDALPTHEVYCKFKQNKKCIDLSTNKEITIEEYYFDRFVFWDGANWSYKEPFGFALLENENENVIISIKDVEFFIRRTSIR